MEERSLINVLVVTDALHLLQVSAPLAALIYTAEPLWGGLFAYLVLAERWGPMGWVGAGLIVSASLASQLKGSSSKTPDVSVVVCISSSSLLPSLRDRVTLRDRCAVVASPRHIKG